MDSFTITSNQQVKELLEAQAHIWNHSFGYINSMALKCAVHLGIPDAIYSHGKPMTLNELAYSINLHPTKAASFPRLMRLLSHNKFFTIQNQAEGETRYGLTLNSLLLVKKHPYCFGPQVCLQTPILTDPAHEFQSWFQNEDATPFHMVHGKSIWEYASSDGEINDIFNKGMASDAKFVTSLLMASDEGKLIFDGVESLVDVGGGDGSMAKAISMVYPKMKCMVLDLPHVVNGLDGDGHSLVYVSGDMFESIPHGQVLLLKWILHDWSDEHCIKVLGHCREAIPTKDQGGKVIIIDIVQSENDNEDKNTITKCLFDMLMMSITIGGKQRTKEEWRKLFHSAGFNDYKFFPILGLRSVIELYLS